MQIQPFIGNNRQISFNGKIATKELIIDTNNISSVVSIKGNKILINLKESIKTEIPSPLALDEYYESLNRIVFDEDSHYALGEIYSEDPSKRPQRVLKGEQPVAAPHKASLIIKNIKESFWKDYIKDAILLDISYRDFLDVYKKAIAKENCDKVFDLNC